MFFGDCMAYNTMLITGGCGFIGTSLISIFLQRQREVKILVLDNFVTGKPEDLAKVTEYNLSSPVDCMSTQGVVLVHGDIREWDAVKRCTKGVDCIIHLAANSGVEPSVEDPRMDMECNVVGTFNILEAARMNGVKRLIFASSGAPAGEVEPPIHEELPPHPVSPYGASKLAGEGYCSAYYRTFDIETVCLRFGNVYGPRSKNKSSVIAKFIRQALNNEPCVIYGDGNQTRDFLYIDDLIEAVILSMEKDVGGETFQIATGREHTVSEVAQVIKDSLSSRGKEMQISYDLPRLGDVKRNYSDIRKAQKMLGWSAKTELAEGIEKTIEYFAQI